MDEEKITIIGGHKFFVRGDGSSGIIPNDEYVEKMEVASDIGTQMHDVICTKVQLTDEEAEAEIKQYSTQMRFYEIANEISRLEDGLKTIKQHIKDKIRKSFEVDWGISDKRSDRLFTETVIELDLIEHMIDEILEGKVEK